MKILYRREKKSKNDFHQSSCWAYYNYMYNNGRTGKEELCKDQMSKFGSIILESEPCYRTICLGRNYKKVPFPYAQHVINYGILEGQKEKKYVYLGQPQLGLMVLHTVSPLKSFKQDAYVSMTDFYNDGVVCLSHEYDYTMRFKTLEELVQFAISTYYAANHGSLSNYISVENDWADKKLRIYLRNLWMVIFRNFQN